ncbi:potassium-transporting ATPase subunit KdpC [Bowmanella sp. Y26]|uniref:potassium-transporting ATPase subunit KdpC n=1 Tax=Bowmanella yangjiangensis TaxID=2811230 RepID=UPI001BDC0B32|nr:potassium-transporting ATPase subunit KdpC [Bowmanella yangjiangensis]MBT1063745.1 potassium-transporting ATPase subunit KdpC [Bowmanella yangjiangensis]
MNATIQHPTFAQHMLTGVRAGLTLLVLCGGVYTGVVTGVGSTLFSHQATGSLLNQGERVIGSEWVAQPFVSDSYFHSRPSAVDYDPTATGGSNLAPSNPELRARVIAQSADIQRKEGVSAEQIPVDMLSTSGAGLDPHISPEAAMLQAPRVARARQLPLEQVQNLVGQAIEGPQWGLFGQHRVNVLKLNLVLDKHQAF